MTRQRGRAYSSLRSLGMTDTIKKIEKERKEQEENERRIKRETESNVNSSLVLLYCSFREVKLLKDTFDVSFSKKEKLYFDGVKKLLNDINQVFDYFDKAINDIMYSCPDQYKTKVWRSLDNAYQSASIPLSFMKESILKNAYDSNDNRKNCFAICFLSARRVIATYLKVADILLNRYVGRFPSLVEMLDINGAIIQYKKMDSNTSFMLSDTTRNDIKQMKEDKSFLNDFVKLTTDESFFEKCYEE